MEWLFLDHDLKLKIIINSIEVNFFQKFQKKFFFNFQENEKNIYRVVAKEILDQVEVIPSVDRSLLSVWVRPKCWNEVLEICFDFWNMKNHEKFSSQILSRDVDKLQTW